MPIAQMLEETLQQMALSVPEDRRGSFVEQMRQVVSVERLRAAALDKMAEIFSTEELDALTAFYGSRLGQSIVVKFPLYMAEVLPAIQLEIARGIRDLRDRSR
jgi:hypothetical protein